MNDWQEAWKGVALISFHVTGRLTEEGAERLRRRLESAEPKKRYMTCDGAKPDGVDHVEVGLGPPRPLLDPAIRSPAP